MLIETHVFFQKGEIVEGLTHAKDNGGNAGSTS